MRTMWLPTLAERAGPKYLRIADALSEDVYAGRLAPGDRLPTHRDLAWRLGVTVGTVSRAYAEAERRGLLVGEVGRGSYVKAGARSTATLAMPDEGGPASIDLGINRPPAEINAPEFAAALAELGRASSLPELINYQAHTGRWEHRVAGAEWLRRRGLDVPAERVMVISGAEHGIAAALMGLTDPGDPVLVEELTWSGTRALGSLQRLSLRPVAMDREGMLPDALESACRATGARLLYTMPTIHNPTTAVVPAERRKTIAQVARDHGLTIVEDDVYGMLMRDGPPPLASYAPERSIYITSVSKCLSPAFRIGYAAVPEDRIGRFTASARALNWMAPPVEAEIVSRWVRSGTADLLARRTREEAAARQRIATEILDGFEYRSVATGLHLWLSLPEPWRAQDVVAAAREGGVSMTSTELFVPGRAAAPHAVRVTVTATRDREQLRRGLSVLARLLEKAPEPCLAVA